MKRFLVFLVCMGCGCASVPPPPPVDQAMLTMASERGLKPQALENGRRIFLTRCTGCHGTIRPERYSSRQWQGILDRMAPQAGLDGDQREDLEEYLELVRAGTGTEVP